jgi:hypothetical protein
MAETGKPRPKESPPPGESLPENPEIKGAGYGYGT